MLLISYLFLPSVFGIEKEIILKTQTGDLYGTLTKPDLPSTKNNTAVLLICGSGPTDQDGNNPQLKNNSIRFLAEDLANAGIASLRYDKRGIAKSTKAAISEDQLRFSDYIKDANEWVNLLAKNYKKVVIIGHSEGSLIGMNVAATNPNVSQYISLAGAGSPADEILKEQLANQPKMVTDMAYPIIDSLKAGKKVANVNPLLNSLFRPNVQGYLISWFAVNPLKEIAKIKIPVLIIQGDKDIQISVQNAEQLAKAQPKAKKIIIPDMNHVLKRIDTIDQTVQLKTYTDPNNKNNPELSKILAEWIR